MGRSTKPKSSTSTKCKVTPIQVAFIVDRYLADNDFAGTRSLFRSEASSLLAKSRASEAPRSLLSLAEILDEYLCLKEQKVMADEAKNQLEQEKNGVESLLEGLQGLVNAYKSSAPPSCLTPSPLLSKSSNASSAVSRSMVLSSPSGYTAIQAPITAPASIPHHNTIAHASNTHSSRKRKVYKAVPHSLEPTKKTPPCNYNTGQTVNSGGSPVQSSSQSPNSNSSGPKTPKRSVSSLKGKSISPQEDMSSAVKSGLTSASSGTMPNNCTIYSSQTITVSSPAKRFSIERKHCTYISPCKSNMSKGDHVKSRLDFDAADLPITSENSSLDVCTTSESHINGDIFDMDLDALGPDFSLSELLNDIGIDWEVGHSSQDAIGASPSEPCEGDFCVSQEPEQSIPKDSAPVASTKSITQCVEIVSPGKKRKRSVDNQARIDGN